MVAFWRGVLGFGGARQITRLFLLQRPSTPHKIFIFLLSSFHPLINIFTFKFFFHFYHLLRKLRKSTSYYYVRFFFIYRINNIVFKPFVYTHVINSYFYRVLVTNPFFIR